MRRLQRFAGTEQRVDWWQVITDLERAGMSHERVAAECLRGKAWVDGIKNGGAEPRFHDGLVLLGLWAEKTKKSKLEYPTEGRARTVGIASS